MHYLLLLLLLRVLLRTPAVLLSTVSLLIATASWLDWLCAVQLHVLRRGPACCSHIHPSRVRLLGLSGQGLRLLHQVA
jgi:hypothetical protein